MTETAEALRQAQDRKRQATAIARLALAGWAVHALADGGFIASRWRMASPTLPDVEALERFADKVEGAKR